MLRDETDLGLIGALASLFAALATFMRFWYRTIKDRFDEVRADRDDRIDELKADRDWWRNRALGTGSTFPRRPPTPDDP